MAELPSADPIETPPSFYERIGGEAGLRAIIDDFVGRIFNDIMIGFFFREGTRDRITRFEFQHACEFLGGPTRYEGRPLREAHARHPIKAGHFARRLEILRRVLAKHHVPADILQAWVEHNAALRGEVTQQGAGDCRG
jgi:hemoglobin